MIFIAKPLYEGVAMKTKELELSEKIERRLEIIHAHTKLEKPIREVIKEFGVCRDTYYYWYHRYVEKGIFGVASKVAETADYHPELDAAEILEVLDCSPEHKPSVATAQRILRSAGMNRPKGRRSKKTMEKKRTSIQAHKKVLKK